MAYKRVYSNNVYLIAVAIPVLLIIFPIGYSVISFAFAGDARSSQPFIERPDAAYENCIRETEFMRFHHWELLRAVREEIVRYGKRGDISLSKCKECHTSRERFCTKCHAAVSMSPDCFGCHNYP